MKVILLLLYFITPAAPGPKMESKRVWMLQSTSQMEFDTACHRIGKDMMAYIKPVATLTVRAYCLCQNGDGKVCPSDTEKLAPLVPVPTVEPL
jgi:hypothetical protein